MPVSSIAPPYGSGEHGAVIGQTGTGKSVLSQYGLIPDKGKLCIVDPKREFDYPGVPIRTSPAEVRFWKDERFIYRPRKDLVYDYEAYNKVLQYCYDAKPDVYLDDKGKKRNRSFFIYVDDMVGILDKSAWPHFLKLCYHQGRSRGITMLSCFQRLSWVPQFLMSESKRFYVFALTLESDADKAASCMGEYDPYCFRNNFEFVYKNIRDYGVKPKLMKLTLPEGTV